MVFYYSSLSDFGISGSKNINAQQVEASLATPDIISDKALNKKFIFQYPPIFLCIYFKIIKTLI